MRLSIVASATLSLLLVLAPGLRAQDEGSKPAKPDKEKKEDKKDDKTKDDKKEKGDEGDDDGDDDKDAGKDEKLPINPFAKAKKGDWSLCVGKAKANFQGQNMDQKIQLIFKVTKVTDDDVEVQMIEKGGAMGGNQKQKCTFSKKEAPSFQKFMNGDKKGMGGPKLKDWKAEDDKKTLGDKEFTCKKITAKVKDQMADGKLTMWITDEAKGWGVIAMTLKATIQGGAGTMTMDVELKGFGNGDTADFGKKPAADENDDESGDDDAPKSKDKKKGADDEEAPKKKDDKKKDKKDDDE